MKKAILTTILMAFFVMPLHSQIFKNSKKKAGQRVENTVTNKVPDKGAPQAGKSADNILSFQMGGSAGFEHADPSEIPQAYDFDWSYVMKMKSREGEIIINFFMKKDAPYFGIKLPENDMYMVMDPSRNLSVTYMRTDGNNMVKATKIPNNLALDIATNNAENDEYSFIKIANKTILGYECEGYQGENRDMVFTFYLTTDPDISFGDIYQSDQTKFPKGFDPNLIKDRNGIMMQMIIEGKKNARNNATMTCIALEKKNFSLNKTDYNTIAGK